MTRPLEPLDVGEVLFLAEQDGPPERELKESLAQLFRQRAAVSASYLARVKYSDGSESVALCLAAPESSELSREIGAIFSGLFGVSSHLDILFLRPEQEPPLKELCSAFYSRRDV